MSTITVGIDGSPGSMTALRWALDEARHRGSTIRAVHAWQLPYHQGYLSHLALERLSQPLIDVAHETLNAALADVSLDTEGITITPVVAEGPSARVLIDAAADADLLVVGSRGYGGFRGLMLGSVSQQCAQGAMCPVVIVPTTGRRSGPAVDDQAWNTKE